MIIHQLLKRFVYLNELNPDGGSSGGGAPAADPPADPATPPVDAGKTPSNDPPADPPKDPPAQKWSDTWREDMAGALPENAGDDEKAEHTKLLNRLKRFNSPADAAKALREQDKLISSGALKRALPKNPTPEQLTEWRKENGIPESADKYDLGVPQDLDLNDLDHEMLGDWAAEAHAANAPPELVKAGTQAFLKMREKVATQMEERNREAKKQVEDALRAEWGQEYRTNVQGVESLLGNSNSQAVRDLLMARTPDGVQLLNNPDVVRWLAGHARELGFVGATVIPQGGDLGKGIDDEIASIEASMFNKDGTKNSAYWGSEKQVKRYSELLEAKKRRQNRE